jgi:hypothetical protein
MPPVTGQEDYWTVLFWSTHWWNQHYRGIDRNCYGLIFLRLCGQFIFRFFPGQSLRAMMLMVGIELIKLVKDVRPDKDIIPMIITIMVALITNMFFGFLCGVIANYLLTMFLKGNKK